MVVEPTPAQERGRVTSPVLPTPEEKPQYVRDMFARISRRYDLMNRIMTAGQDQRWRRMVVEMCNLPPGGRLLDVATGTGDIAYMARHLRPDIEAVGVDFTFEMLAVGREKAPELGVPFVQGDALNLPFADDSFDAACSGFMMRNVADIGSAFAEQRRVVRSGGRVVCLEITHPRFTPWRKLFQFYFFHVVPLVGGVISGARDAYTYLPHSTLPFPDAEGLAEIMRSVGLRNVHYRTLMFGTVAIHIGEK